MVCYCGHIKKEHEYTRDYGVGSGNCRHKNCSCESYTNPVYSYKGGKIKEKWHANINASNGKRMRNTLTQESQS